MSKAHIVLGVFCATVLSASISKADDCVYYLHDKCYDCNTPYNLKVGTKDNCEVKCPNRVFVFKDRTCRLKVGQSTDFPPSSDTSTDIKNCTLPTGQKNKATKDTVESYFIGNNGKCYPCSTKEAVRVSSSDCDKKRFCHSNCSNRTPKHHNSEDVLYSVYSCPSNRPLMDRFMMCWPCNEPTPIDLSFDMDFNKKCNSKRNMEHITINNVIKKLKGGYANSVLKPKNIC